LDGYDDLSDFHLDALREVGNIGAGNAATALASLLTDKINISVPILKIIDVSDISSALDGPETPAVGILLSMSGDINGMLLFILNNEFTSLLLNTLLGEKTDGFYNLSELGLSALQEIGNILAGSYINAIASLTNLNIYLSPPGIAIDMIGAILNVPAAQFGTMGDKVLLIEEDFISGTDVMRSHLLILPEIDSVNIILSKLGVL